MFFITSPIFPNYSATIGTKIDTSKLEVGSIVFLESKMPFSQHPGVVGNWAQKASKAFSRNKWKFEEGSTNMSHTLMYVGEGMFFDIGQDFGAAYSSKMIPRDDFRLVRLSKKNDTHFLSMYPDKEREEAGDLYNYHFFNNKNKEVGKESAALAKLFVERYQHNRKKKKTLFGYRRSGYNALSAASSLFRSNSFESRAENNLLSSTADAIMLKKCANFVPNRKYFCSSMVANIQQMAEVMILLEKKNDPILKRTINCKNLPQARKKILEELKKKESLSANLDLKIHADTVTPAGLYSYFKYSNDKYDHSATLRSPRKPRPSPKKKHSGIGREYLINHRGKIKRVDIPPKPKSLFGRLKDYTREKRDLFYQYLQDICQDKVQGLNPVLIYLAKQKKASPQCLKLKDADKTCPRNIEEAETKMTVDKKCSSQERSTSSCEEALFEVILSSAHVDARMFEQILRGGHVQIQDKGKTYKKLKKTMFSDLCKKESSKRKSSHKSSRQQFGHHGKFAEWLIGSTEESSWFQLERSAGTINLEGIKHLGDFFLYKKTGDNIGPAGRSVHTDKNPMTFQRKRRHSTSRSTQSAR